MVAMAAAAVAVAVVDAQVAAGTAVAAVDDRADPAARAAHLAAENPEKPIK